MGMPEFEDLREMVEPEAESHQRSMDRYYDQLEEALPAESSKHMLREFDSYWMMRAEALADAAFIHGFLIGRRMGRYLTRGSGSGEEE